ncbi:MAG: methylmalonyl Co-A mutase-associated GTPase MeaB [Acidimicrobiia bacterium]|nr:methylmalonyl Co-A mutase-associated GTPase MeaB [Acidimicrobiia bacterium]
MSHPPLLDSLIAGDRRALARAISVVEDRRTGWTELLAAAWPARRGARLVGITGAPGAGKSSLVDGLVEHCRSFGWNVAVVAVDPSSPFTGGALLGDRIRMQRHVSDPGVYVRSMSARGHLGGLSDATSGVTVLLDAAGFDPIIVETVGVGQSEIEVIGAVETTVVVLTPGWGDSVQAAKAGLLEAGDVFVVNKSDLPGATETAADIEAMIELGMPVSWRPPVVLASATLSQGIQDLWAAVAAHRESIEASGEAAARRSRRYLDQFERAVAAGIRFAQAPSDLLADVESGAVDPWTAARLLIGGQTSRTTSASSA